MGLLKIYPFPMSQASFLDQLSLHARHSLKEARDIARYTKSQTIEPRHLLLSLSLENGSLGSFLIESIGFDKEKLGKLCLKREKSTQKFPKNFVPALSEAVSDILRDAYALAQKRAFPYVGTEHLVEALLSSEVEEIRSITTTLGIKETKVAATLENHLSFNHFPELPNFLESSEALLTKSPTKNKKKSRTPALDQYATEITTSPNTPRVIGRDAELDRLLTILSRRTKNNPLLIGEPGVGKTALVEALARRLTEGQVPRGLLQKRILTLDLALVVAGTNFRGEFETRIKQIVEEAKASPEVILFIDEIHTLVGAGNATGSLDAANILKPALARGEIRCIGATTLTEYKRHIEKDPALERRFQSLLVREPDTEETRAILLATKELYEKYHHVLLSQDIIDLTVDLAMRSLPERFFPDKAFDILDEASARAAAGRQEKKHSAFPTLLRDYEAARVIKEELVNEEKFDEAFVWHKTEEKLALRIQKISEGTHESDSILRIPVTPTHVFTAVSHMTGIPLDKLSHQTPDRKWATFTRALKKHFIGQPEVSTALKNTLVRTLSGINHPDRPLGSFLLLGPTGVGKTYLAKILAREFFGHEKHLIRIDMSEFMEKHSVAQMIGAPAGYVGYGEGGKLTERVRRNPFSVVLFDEIEKAHPDILNILLQILDEGVLTDAEGRTTSFKNTLILITSNIGTAAFTETSAIGFTKHGNEMDLSERFASIEQQVMTELRKTLRPELLARLSETLVFLPLDTHSIEAITKRELEALKERLKKKSHALTWSPEVIRLVAQKSFSPLHGARLIRKHLETLVEYPLAEALIRHRTAKHIALAVRHHTIVCITR